MGYGSALKIHGLMFLLNETSHSEAGVSGDRDCKKRRSLSQPKAGFSKEIIYT